MELTLLIIGKESEINLRQEAGIRTVYIDSPEAAPVYVSDKDKWVMLTEGDSLKAEDITRIKESLQKYPGAEIIFQKRAYKRSKKTVAFSEALRESGLVRPEELYLLHAWLLEGTIMRAHIFKALFKDKHYGSFSIMKELLNAQEVAAKRNALLWISDSVYQYSSSYEGDRTFFPGIYERKWYEELLFYLEKRAEELQGVSGRMKKTEQYQVMFLIDFAFEANLNNVNKHLFEGEAAKKLLESFGKALRMIDTETILDSSFAIAGKNSYLRRWVYLILKYNDRRLTYDIFCENGSWYFGYNGIKAGSFDEVTADIISMDYDGSTLVIEGRVSPVAYMSGVSFYLYADDKRIEPQIRERYALTKAFGVSIYKLISFHAEIELENKPSRISFVAEGAALSLPVSLEFDSHFSRITNRFMHSYWRMNKSLMMLPERSSLTVKAAGGLERMSRELLLWLDMLKTGQKKIIKYIPVRLFMLLKPLFKHRKLWLFIDKIYKGGDSSEYLWRYVKEHDKSIEALYLLDSTSSDYKRLEASGEKPLKRHSLSHRRAFLYADWIIISNSTVFAFNDFSTKNSAYIRDLIGFKVACVQHGMSVQKIAVAQNRLRDNISLYFCASKYEIENLSRPVYDYAGYDILKLTGVPRYDGLVSNDKKQLLISPTWRMQAAVPVTKNESVMRDYNPLFKETSYYRVYNSLINDERLLAAAKKYGYTIVYVLHPIVSAQIGDFEKNENVTILAGGGDMSYEKLLCESSLMVTDYSGVQFDFAYMRKPVVYLHHKDIPEHYEEGSFFYDTMGFGEIARDNDELIDLLIAYMQESCRMKAEYKRRADDFFEFNDRENCARIYEEMLKADK